MTSLSPQMRKPSSRGVRILKKGKKHLASVLLTALAILIAMMFLLPMYYIVINAFKPFADVMLSFVSFPKELYLGNIVKAYTDLNYSITLVNSVIITALGVAGVVLLSAMAAWKLARIQTLLTRILYNYLTISMVVPFFAIMIPLVQWMFRLGLAKTRLGLILVYWGMGISFALFLFRGFIKSVPMELEESARIDGCGDYRTFFRVTFPLLSPTVGTLVVLDSLWIWNDFLLPMLLIYPKPGLRTVPLAAYNYFGENVQQWNLAIAGVLLSILPCIIFFIFMQRYIIKGITSGAVKG